MVSTRSLLIFTLILSCIWTLVIYYKISSSSSASDIFRREILHLSRQYVNALSQEAVEKNIPVESSHDLRKTMAVVLQEILLRLDRLEGIAKNATFLDKENVNNESEAPPLRRIRRDVRNMDETNKNSCLLPDNYEMTHPSCDSKIEWLMENWRQDTCYHHFGVDGQRCSIVKYLSEVEHFCPPFSSINQSNSRAYSGNTSASNGETVSVNITSLLKKLVPQTFIGSIDFQNELILFIKNRIVDLWTDWMSAAHQFRNDGDLVSTKRVLIHLGYPSTLDRRHTGMEWGILFPWSDIIASHHVLGHDVTVSWSLVQLQRFLASIIVKNSMCELEQELSDVVIYSDLLGVQQIKERLPPRVYERLRCILRVLHSSNDEINLDTQYKAGHGLKSPCSLLHLHPKQIFTIFPHETVNSYIGYVQVSGTLHSSKFIVKSNKRYSRTKPMALLYTVGHVDWKKYIPYLQLLHEYFDVYATVSQELLNPNNDMPSFIQNKANISWNEYENLLQNVTVFVGLSFPIEDPLPLEAIKRGAIFLNPQLQSNAESSTNERSCTKLHFPSQHPYIQDTFGEPYSFLIDWKNLTMVDVVLKRIIHLATRKTLQNFLQLPFVSTWEMLQSVTEVLQHRDFCTPRSDSLMRKGSRQVLNNYNLPRPSIQYNVSVENEVEYYIGKEGESCTNTCALVNLSCQPDYIYLINSPARLRIHGLSCSSIQYGLDISAPVIILNSNVKAPLKLSPSHQSLFTDVKCIFLKNLVFFTCSNSHVAHRRICPCKSL